MRGYVDESSREGPSGFCYVLAAAVAVEDEDQARQAMDKLRPTRAAYVHWHDAIPAVRFELIDTLSRLNLQAFVTYQHPVTAKRQERARRLCLGALADDLATEGVDDMVIESRQKTQDKADRLLMYRLQQSGRAVGLSYGHVNKRAEPLLWAADVVAGAVSMHVAGVDSRYYTDLKVALLRIRTAE